MSRTAEERKVQRLTAADVAYRTSKEQRLPTRVQDRAVITSAARQVAAILNARRPAATNDGPSNREPYRALASSEANPGAEAASAA